RRLMGSDDIFPLAVERLRMQIHLLHLGLGDSSTRRVLAPIQTAGYGQAGRGRGARNELHDRLVVPERLASPVRGDEGKQSVFDLIPLRTRKLTKLSMS